MAKWDVDFDDYEEKEGGGYDGEQPKPGLYDARLVEFDAHEGGKSDTSMKFVFEITDGDYEGWRGWVYSDLENSKWKTQQIVKAIQGGAEKKMRLDPENSAAIVKKAKPVRIRTRYEKYEGENRAKIRVVLPAEAGKSNGRKGSDDPWADDDED